MFVFVAGSNARIPAETADSSGALPICVVPGDTLLLKLILVALHQFNPVTIPIVEETDA